MEFLIGFVVAIVIAMTGVGASVVTAPLLIFLLKVPVDIAVSTTLAYSAIVKLIVVPFQVARRQVNYRILGIMLLGGVPGVVLGSVLFKHVAAHGPRAALSFALGLIILFTAGWHLYRHFRPSDTKRSWKDRAGWVGLIMFPIGAEVGFSSAGAGALGTVALLGLTSLTATQVVGTDLAFGLVIALVGSGVHLIGGHYDTALLTHLVAGGVIGGLIGSGVAPKIPNRGLRFALSLWLLYIGLQFCYQAATH
ncbi:MAG: sulfite exporter TauE/SafE family protein [Acidobacteriota bacterium]|nr:sulfite exporter TauE/SafE family protein [Acidobacteriota bacterium]